MDFDDEGRRRDGRELTYSDYINVPALLRAQRLPTELPRGRKPDEWPAPPQVTGRDGEEKSWHPGDAWPDAWPHDEHLFIVTHQTFELWFKQMLLDLDDVMARATSVLARHGLALPAADLASRETADATPLREVLSQLPQSERVVREVLARSEWERRWVQELHEPACFPRRDPDRARLSLALFDDATLAHFARRVDRASRILRHATGGFDLLSTMPPEEFLAFRSRLNPASGFGSTQFRELELLGGHKDVHRRKLSGEGELSFRRHMPADEVAAMERRLAAPSLRDLVYALLDATEMDALGGGPQALADRILSRNLLLLHRDFEAARARFGEAPDMESHLHAQWRSVDEILTHAECVRLAGLYTDPTLGMRPALREFLERCLELDDALNRWRLAHIPMVERAIGSRPGTGGGGLAYLQTTLRQGRLFPCLWDFRSVLTAPE